MTRRNHRPGRDRALGMDAPITRRDFLNGASIAVGGSIAGGLLPKVTATGWAAAPAPQDATGYYPPALNWAAGESPGQLRSRPRPAQWHPWSRLYKITDAGERYDLVIVGGGISGLSAGYFFRSRRNTACILILDYHDDFGGHAKRNEFQLAERLALITASTLSHSRKHRP
jgi:spermidine dehydrogenase